MVIYFVRHTFITFSSILAHNLCTIFLVFRCMSKCLTVFDPLAFNVLQFRASRDVGHAPFRKSCMNHVRNVAVKVQCKFQLHSLTCWLPCMFSCRKSATADPVFVFRLRRKVIRVCQSAEHTHLSNCMKTTVFNRNFTAEKASKHLGWAVAAD